MTAVNSSSLAGQFSPSLRPPTYIDATARLTGTNALVPYRRPLVADAGYFYDTIRDAILTCARKPT